MEVRITESPLSTKKYRILFPNKKTVDIGANDYSDYTLHKDTAARGAGPRRAAVVGTPIPSDAGGSFGGLLLFPRHRGGRRAGVAGHAARARRRRAYDDI